RGSGAGRDDGSLDHGRGQRPVPDVPRTAVLPARRRRGPGDRMRFSAHDVVRAISPETEPTDEQVAVIEADDTPTLVVAGAGSGKTQTMSQRIVWLVANDLAAPEEILGLTFTRKAAGELAERIHRQLRRWWASTGEVVTTSAGPTVATYNSYAASVVADHALRIGHDPGARVLSEGSRWQLAHEVVESFDFADDAPSYAVKTLVNAVLSLSDAFAEHLDRKSTRLNSSHVKTSYAVFCLKKKIER